MRNCDKLARDPKYCGIHMGAVKHAEPSPAHRTAVREECSAYQGEDGDGRRGRGGERGEEVEHGHLDPCPDLSTTK